MVNKWLGNFDLSKLALDTTSGFIVLVAILFILDALTAEHVIKNILTDNTAGSIVVFVLVAGLGSSVLGLMLDSVFHTFGRNFAKAFWGKNKENPYKNKYQSFKEFWYCKHDKYWQFNLQRMVLEPDPIKYLEQFL